MGLLAEQEFLQGLDILSLRAEKGVESEGGRKDTGQNTATLHTKAPKAGDLVMGRKPSQPVWRQGL